VAVLTLCQAALAGCGAVEPVPAPPDAASIRDKIERAWDQQGAQALGYLNELPDPVMQLALLEGLVTDGQCGSMGMNRACEQLVDPEVARRCAALATRPHLFFCSQSGSLRAPSAPGSNALPERGAATAAGQDAEARVAREAATPADACQVLAPGLWRDECVLETAEQQLRQHGVTHIAEAQATCDDAGQLESSCYWNLGFWLPPMHGEGLKGWRQVVQSSTHLVDQPDLAPYDGSDKRAPMATTWWAMALEQACVNDCRMDFSFPKLLPEAAHPALRELVAVRLLARPGSCEGTLEACAAEVQELVDGSKRAFQLGDHYDPSASGSICIHDMNTPPPELKPTRTIGGDLRPQAPAPIDDATVAVLLAAAKILPDPQPMLEQGQAHADPSVRWTATELRRLGRGQRSGRAIPCRPYFSTQSL
jgi:hypothetical protein